MTIKVQPSADTQWITVSINGADLTDTIVAIDRGALQTIIQEDPRPPELILDLLCERAVKRMPVPNGEHGVRLITAYNLSLVWPK